MLLLCFISEDSGINSYDMLIKPWWTSEQDLLELEVGLQRCDGRDVSNEQEWEYDQKVVALNLCKN